MVTRQLSVGDKKSCIILGFFSLIIFLSGFMFFGKQAAMPFPSFLFICAVTFILIGIGCCLFFLLIFMLWGQRRVSWDNDTSKLVELYILWGFEIGSVMANTEGYEKPDIEEQTQLSYPASIAACYATNQTLSSATLVVMTLLDLYRRGFIRFRKAHYQYTFFKKILRVHTGYIILPGIPDPPAAAGSLENKILDIVLNWEKKDKYYLNPMGPEITDVICNLYSTTVSFPGRLLYSWVEQDAAQLGLGEHQKNFWGNSKFTFYSKIPPELVLDATKIQNMYNNFETRYHEFSAEMTAAIEKAFSKQTDNS